MPDVDRIPCAPTEEPVMLVEVFITRRRGDFLARMSIDEQAGWIGHVGEDPFDALEGAVSAARESLTARLSARRLQRGERDPAIG